MTYPPGRSELARRDQPGQVPASARLVSGAMEQVFSAICFLESSGSGGFTASAIPLR
jgi:hypothetical protein